MNKKSIVTALLIVVLSILACTMNVPFAQKTATPTPIPVTTEAIQSLEKTVESAATQVQETGQVNLVLDEAQLTSIAAVELEKQADLPIKDPQIHLQDGQIQITGNVVRQGVSIPAQIIITASVNPEGSPELKIVSAKIGPLPLPGKVLTDFNAQLNQAFLEQFNSLAPDTQVDSITISDGKMTINGHTR